MQLQSHARAQPSPPAEALLGDRGRRAACRGITQPDPDSSRLRSAESAREHVVRSDLPDGVGGISTSRTGPASRRPPTLFCVVLGEVR